MDMQISVTGVEVLEEPSHSDRYRYAGSYVFDGTNYIDTGIKLFSEENINKNFEISFEISDVAANQGNQATIVNAMEEVDPYPGFVFRIQTNKTQLEFNAPKIKTKTGININSTNKIVMKRINDIYYIQVNDGNIEKLGTYSYGKTFDVPIVLGTSLDTNPKRWFKGTLSNINIEVWEPEKYTVVFDANGGTGTMDNQIIRKDETISLTANVFDKENWTFDAWNTKADGSGTEYSDKEAVTNIALPNESIKLYAQWTQGTYSVRFNNNGGTGTMPNQEFSLGEYQNLSTNSFTNGNKIFAGWNTKADGKGTSYKDAQSVKNLTKNINGVVDLYAIWSESSYTANELVFDGTNYVDTGIYLFDANTINRDFEISFEITEQSATQVKQATIISAMDESGSPWPGIVYRFTSDVKQHQIGANVNSSIKTEQNLGINNTKVYIKRTDGVLYLKLNDGDYRKILDMTSLDKTFHVPLTIGSSLTNKGVPQRQFTGTLSNVSVTVY